MLKFNASLGVLLGVVLLLGAWIGRQCSQPKNAHDIALDSLAIQTAQSVKDSTLWSGVVDDAKDEANEKVRRGEVEMAEARRMVRRALALQARRDTLKPSPTSDTSSQPPRLPDSRTAFDTLLVAFESCDRAYVSCSAANVAKDSIIAADARYISSLERVKQAAVTVVETRSGRKLFGCSLGPAALVALDGSISAGAGVSCGFRL